MTEINNSLHVHGQDLFTFCADDMAKRERVKLQFYICNGTSFLYKILLTTFHVFEELKVSKISAQNLVEDIETWNNYSCI